jgi:hypothetical protein
MKQTAVEWYFKQMQSKEHFTQDEFDSIYDQAKEIEKEQIEDAFCDGVDDEYEQHINNEIRKNSEQYYNETFKNK